MLGCYEQPLMVSYRAFLSSFPKSFLSSFFLYNMKNNRKLWVKLLLSSSTAERSWHHLSHTFVTQRITSHQVPVSLASFLGMTQQLCHAIVVCDEFLILCGNAAFSQTDKARSFLPWRTYGSWHLGGPTSAERSLLSRLDAIFWHQ